MNKQLKNIGIGLFVLLFNASSSIAVTFDWAEIGNAGNTADTTNYGSVGYDYNISTTEVTTAQYVEFLNAVADTDTNGLYNVFMAGSLYYKGITRSGSSGSYTYSANAGWENRPVVYVSWYDTLRFVNWLHNGQPVGMQDASTTEYGAYDMSLQQTNPESIVRLAGAQYWLPSENEWYKAAYYDPVNEIYYDYAIGMDGRPSNMSPDQNLLYSANYYYMGYTIGSPYYTTEVGAYTLSASPYGTYDQSGNVSEWNESLIGSSRGVRGGAWNLTEYNMQSIAQSGLSPTDESDSGLGFRIAGVYTGDDAAAIPEPMSIGLVLLSLGGLVIRRVKKN